VIALHVQGRYRKALERATASIAGKRVATFRGGKARLDLTGRPAGKVVVTIALKLRGHRTRTDVRRYALCATRR
jgi:hypothetical protein